MDKFTIKKAGSSDAEKILKLGLLLQQHAEKSNSSIWRITDEGKNLMKQQVKDDLTDSNVHFLLAETKREAVGFVEGEIIRRTDHLPRSVGHISRLYVVKQFRRKGVGSLLVKELVKMLNSEKIEDLTVRYIVGNREAEGFWTKLGFKPIITTSNADPEKLYSKLTPTTNYVRST